MHPSCLYVTDLYANISISHILLYGTADMLVERGKSRIPGDMVKITCLCVGSALNNV